MHSTATQKWTKKFRKKIQYLDEGADESVRRTRTATIGAMSQHHTERCPAGGAHTDAGRVVETLDPGEERQGWGQQDDDDLPHERDVAVCKDLHIDVVGGEGWLGGRGLAGDGVEE